MAGVDWKYQVASNVERVERGRYETEETIAAIFIYVYIIYGCKVAERSTDKTGRSNSLFVEVMQVETRTRNILGSLIQIYAHIG